MRVIKEEKKDTINIILVDMESYDSIEYITDIISKKFGSKILKQIDGPGCRIWDLSINNQPIQLSFDDMLCLEILFKKISKELFEDMFEYFKTVEIEEL